MTVPVVEVRGNASAEEMAVVLALVSRSPEPAAVPTAYETWRRTRLAALRRDRPGDDGFGFLTS
jgi:hypothetical protein